MWQHDFHRRRFWVDGAGETLFNRNKPVETRYEEKQVKDGNGLRKRVPLTPRAHEKAVDAILRDRT